MKLFRKRHKTPFPTATNRKCSSSACLFFVVIYYYLNIAYVSRLQLKEDKMCIYVCVCVGVHVYLQGVEDDEDVGHDN